MLLPGLCFELVFVPLFKKGIKCEWVISKVNLHVFIGESFQNTASLSTRVLVFFFSESTSLGLGTPPSKLILSFKVYLRLDIPNSRVKSFKSVKQVSLEINQVEYICEGRELSSTMVFLLILSVPESCYWFCTWKGDI